MVPYSYTSDPYNPTKIPIMKIQNIVDNCHCDHKIDQLEQQHKLLIKKLCYTKAISISSLILTIILLLIIITAVIMNPSIIIINTSALFKSTTVSSMRIQESTTSPLTPITFSLSTTTTSSTTAMPTTSVPSTPDPSIPPTTPPITVPSSTSAATTMLTTTTPITSIPSTPEPTTTSPQTTQTIIFESKMEKTNISMEIKQITSPTTDSLSIDSFIPRDKWLASPYSHRTPLNLPTRNVIIAHTSTRSCQTFTECSSIVLNIQKFHMFNQHWDDIGYNFLIGGDGNVYEGRGWYAQGAHTKNFNSQSIAIAFIGSFELIKPNEKMLSVTKSLLNSGILGKMLSTDYRLFGHRQLIATLSPGKKLYEIIQTWDHWAMTF